MGRCEGTASALQTAHLFPKGRELRTRALARRAPEHGPSPGRDTMAWKGPHPMLLLVLLATWLALARGETRFQKFQRQHVAPPRTDHQDNRVYCNRMMQNRSMICPVCKPTNTFVHVDDVNTITDVCGPGGIPAGENLHDSIAHFALTTCRLRGGSQGPLCNYNGYSGYRRIRIACVRRLPVHYCGAIQPLLSA